MYGIYLGQQVSYEFAFLLIDPKTGKLMANQEVHVRVEKAEDVKAAPKAIGGSRMNVVSDAQGVLRFQDPHGAVAGGPPRLVSLTPYMPGVSRGDNKAITWRFPLASAASPAKPLKIYNQPGAGIQHDFPGAVRPFPVMLLGAAAAVGLGIYWFTQKR